MCARSKFIIVTLHRVQIASILSIETVPNPGDCRWLSAHEVRELYEGLGLDSSNIVPSESACVKRTKGDIKDSSNEL